MEWHIEETKRLRESGKFKVPADVEWRVDPFSSPDKPELELSVPGGSVIVDATQEAIDSACRNIAFRDQPHRGYNPR